MSLKSLKEGELGLIRVKDGRIIQIGLTEGQRSALIGFLSLISKDSPLVEMGEDHDLTRIKPFHEKQD